MSFFWKIRIIVVVELFIWVSDYVDYLIFDDVFVCKKIFIDYFDILFLLILFDDGGVNFDRIWNREDVIICEVVKICEDNLWLFMVYLFGLCSVLDVCIEFVYFNVNEGLCLLFNWIIYFLDRIINDEK